MITVKTITISKQRGFTLLEILVTVLIVSFGLLGLAGLQLIGIKNTQSGYLRSQVSFLAGDMMDRVQANPIGTIQGKYNLAANATPTNTNCLGDTIQCNTTDLANYDMTEWRKYLSNYLPGGTGSISSVAGATYLTVTVNISWIDEYASELTQSETFNMNFPL